MPSQLLLLLAVVSATALFELANGVLTTWIPIRLGNANVDGSVTSMVAAAYTLEFIVGCLWGPRVIAAVGHIRASAAFRPLLTILITVSFAFVWITAGFYVFYCTDFGFLAIIGALGLVGMTNKNMVVLLDAAEANPASGMSRFEAIV